MKLKAASSDLNSFSYTHFGDYLVNLAISKAFLLKKPPIFAATLPQKKGTHPKRTVNKDVLHETVINSDDVLMKLIRDAVIALDADFHIQHWNRGAEEIYGWTEKEVMGRISYELFETDFKSSSPEDIKENLVSLGYDRKEVTHKTKSGKFINVATSASAITDTNGALTGIILITRNITDRKKQETELTYHAALMENIRDGVFSIDNDFVIKSWNKGAEAMYGWTASEAIGQISYELLHTDYYPDSKEELVKSFRTKGFYRGDITQKTKAGNTVIVDMNATVIHDKEGNITGAVTLNKDITEIKTKEKQLKELTKNLKKQVAIQTKELANIFERVTEGFTAFDKKWNFTFINKKAGELFGCSPEELIGKNIWKVFPEAIGLPFYKAYHKAMETQQYTHLLEYYQPFNRWYENNIYPSPEGISIYFKDITDKKNAEEKLAKANRLYHFISSVNQMIIRTTDEQTLFRETCRIAIDSGKFKMAWIGLLDEKTRMVHPVMYEGLDLDYLNTIKVIADTDAPEGKGPSGRALEEGKTNFCNDITTDPRMAPWKEEALKRGYCSCIAIPIRRLGKVIGIFTLYAGVINFFDEEEIALLEEAANDISFALDFLEKESMRKKAQESLLKSERRYQTLTEVSPSGIFHTNKAGLVTYVNPQWCHISGLNKTEATGNGWLNAVHEEDRENIVKPWLDTKVPHKPLKHEFRFVHKTGEIVWVIAQVLPEKNSENQTIGYVGTVTDITNRKKTEESIQKINEQLNLSQKIAKIGYWKIDMLANKNYWSDQMYEFYQSEKSETVITPEFFYNRIHPDDKNNVKSRFEALVNNGKVFKNLEYRFLAKGGGIRYMLSTGEIMIDNKGKYILAHGTMQDITERKKVQLDFIKEKQLSDSIIDNLPGIFYIYNRDGKFIRWNKNFESVTQFSADEISNMRRLDFVPVDQRKEMSQTISQTFLVGKISVLSHFITKNGEINPFYLTGMLIEYHGEPCLMVIGIDYSERAMIQEEMKKTAKQLQDLTDHLQTIREEERKRIGRELHDELGQQLTAMKMDIVWINKKFSHESPLIKEKMKEVIELLGGSNTALRRILNELRPAILDQHGLLDALQWQAKQFTAHTNIPVELNTTEKNIRVSDQIATCIFRVFQESLTNITRYAEANKVVTFVGIKNRKIMIDIEDNGKGFDTASEQPKSRQPFGILGMKERVRALNGTFELISQPGNGTKIHISLPLQY